MPVAFDDDDENPLDDLDFDDLDDDEPDLSDWGGEEDGGEAIAEATDLTMCPQCNAMPTDDGVPECKGCDGIGWI